MSELQEIIPFATSIYVSEIDYDNDKLLSEIESVRKQDPAGVNISNKGGWQSEDIQAMQPQHFMYPLLTEKLMPLVAEIYKTYEVDANNEVTLSNCWFNINGYKDYNVSHVHPHSYFSAVYYVKTPPDSGNILFSRPDTFNEYVRIKKDADPDNYRVWENYRINVKEGLFVIFPSHIRHWVEQNLSQDERVSIAFNFV
jgi:uncharacterized protein (TIGR02466 family)